MATMIVEPKAKKKRNPLTRLAETTQLLTRFTSKTKILRPSIQQPISSSAPLSSYPITSVSSKSKSKHPIKFKTGGIVATAVQTSEAHKKRRLRAISTIKPNAKKLQQNNDSATMLAHAVNELLRKTSSSNVDQNKAASCPQESITKKIKSKIKRKSKKL